MRLFGKKPEPRPIYPNIYNAVKLITEKFENIYSKTLFNKIPFFNFNEPELQKFTVFEFLNYLKILEFVSENKFSFYSDNEILILNFFNSEKNKFIQQIYEYENLIDKNCEIKILENNVTENKKIILPAPLPLRNKNKYIFYNIEFDKEIYFPRVEYRKYKSKKFGFFELELYLVFLEIKPNVLINYEKISDIPDLNKYFSYFKFKDKILYYPKARLFIFDIYSDYPFIDVVPKKEHFKISEFNGSFFSPLNETIWNITDIKIPDIDIAESTPLIELVLSDTSHIYRYRYKPFSNTLSPVFTEFRKIW